MTAKAMVAFQGEKIHRYLALRTIQTYFVSELSACRGRVSGDQPTVASCALHHPVKTSSLHMAAYKTELQDSLNGERKDRI